MKFALIRTFMPCISAFNPTKPVDTVEKANVNILNNYVHWAYFLHRNMEPTKSKKTGIAFAIGLGIGLILYKVIFQMLWPLIFK